MSEIPLDSTAERLQALLGCVVRMPADLRNAYTVNISPDACRAISRFMEKYDDAMSSSFMNVEASGRVGKSKLLFYKNEIDEDTEAHFKFIEGHLAEIKTALGSFDLEAAEFRQDLLDAAGIVDPDDFTGFRDPKKR